MTLGHLLILAVAGLLASLLGRERWCRWILLVVSIVALYWLQPPTPIRHLDFWLPTASLTLAVLVWAVTRVPDVAESAPRATLITAAVIISAVLIIALTRYLGPLCCLTSSRPPATPYVILAVIGMAVLAAATFRWAKHSRWPTMIFTVIIVALFLVLKAEPLGDIASAGLRVLAGQSVTLAAAIDLRWLGFSYLAFRLLHALRDRASGRLPALSLREFVTYALFFPALTAGPIDRSERFVKDLRLPFAITMPDVVEAGRRITFGVFKKFALADTLAIIALNDANAAQTTSGWWLWVLVYAYAWRLYLDFSGYTDIAIGLGLLVGVRLPENFDRPYFKPDLTAFWNSWHITLAQWFRAYFFNPATRTLRSRRLPVPAIILISQIGTMLLIGLWHGVTWNFVAWGLWHALGLFIHNRWVEFSKARLMASENPSPLKTALNAVGIVATFNFVALGWVWFALSDPALSLTVLLRLLGL